MENSKIDINVDPATSGRTGRREEKQGSSFGSAPDKPEAQMTIERPKPRSNFALKLISIIGLLVIVGAGLYFISSYTNWNILGLKKEVKEGAEGIIKPKTTWQAVFLTNGQVYFGHLTKEREQYVELSDIYYLQVQNVPIQPAEPASTEEGGVQPAQQTQQQLILVKFGTELHRPQDKMVINRDHVLFYEDMQGESAVVQAIERYISGQQ